MTQPFFSSNVFLAWHDWAQVLAFAVLALVFILTALQYVSSDWNRVGRRLLYGGSLRRNLIASFVLVGALPTAALGVLLAERSAHLHRDSTAGLLERSAAVVAGDVNHVLNTYVAGVTTAAAGVREQELRDSDSLSRVLLINHETYSDFLTMLATDQDGNVLAATSNMSGFLATVPDLRLHSVSDRPYFHEPMADGAPFVSEAFLGRALGRDPIVAISAPMFDADNKPSGVLEGSLNLRLFKQLHQARAHLEGAATIIVDQDDRVIFASAQQGLTELQSLAGDPLITAASTDSTHSSYDFVSESDEGKQQYLGAFASTNNGWKVFVRIPIDQIVRQMRSDYATAGLLMLIACLLSLFSVGAIVKRVNRTVDDMNTAVASFKADGTGEKIHTPASTPLEFRPIFRQMRERARNLRRANERLDHSIAAGDDLRSKLAMSIARKEAEIAERTAALEQENIQLMGLSHSDALTGIPNRREFDSFRERIWRTGARNQTPVAVIMLDIDYFKIYNDALGHQAGDDCLIKVAQTLHGCAARPLDLVARYGGEEFAAVLGEATRADALVVAERMRKSVQDMNVPHPGSSHKVVTVSTGVVSTIPVSGEKSEALLKSADEALYYAKAAGRNCVVYQQGGEYVTHDVADSNTSATNVIAILSGTVPPSGH